MRCLYELTNSIIQDSPASEDSDERNIEKARRLLRSLGVNVAWCTEDV
jgi:hypothetical protein